MAWQRLISLSSIVRKPVDLLIFPEVSVPFGRDRKIYPYDDSEIILSPLTHFKHQDVLLANIDWMQALSNHFVLSDSYRIRTLGRTRIYTTPLQLSRMYLSTRRASWI